MTAHSCVDGKNVGIKSIGSICRMKRVVVRIQSIGDHPYPYSSQISPVLKILIDVSLCHRV